MDQRGYILLPVVLAITLIATLAFLMNREGGMNVAMTANEMQSAQARYVAEAGLNHAKWRLAQVSGCTGYTDLAATAFGSDSYSATVNPKNGSPVTITATGTLTDGATNSLSRSVVKLNATPVNLTLQPGTPGKDTFLDALSPIGNYGAHNELRIWTGRYVSLIQFDLSALPNGSRVTSAALWLNQKGGSGSGSAAIGVHRVTRAWTEGSKKGPGTADGATWTTYDGTRLWSLPGGDYDATPAVTSAFTTAPGWKNWDVTALVASWVDGIYPHYGMLLKAAGDVNDARFNSSDDSNAGERPKLILTYLPPCT